MKLKRIAITCSVLMGLAIFVLATLITTRVLQYAGSEINPGTRNGALLAAITADDMVAMRALLLVGANPNFEFGYSALAHAAQEGNLRAVRVLLNAGALPDGPGNTYNFNRPLFVAAAHGHQAIVDELRKHGAKYEPVDALFLGDDATVQEALALNPGVFSELKFHRSNLLFAAVIFNNEIALRTLLELGLDPNESGWDEKTAVDFARRRGRTNLLTIFEAATDAPDSP